MNCLHCKSVFKDILKHLRKNVDCQVEYDMDKLVSERRMQRLRRHRETMKVLNQDNKEKIKIRNAAAYKRKQSNIYQRKRFKKFFNLKDAHSYVSDQQKHLFLHTQGICEPNSSTLIGLSVLLVIKHSAHSVERK